jgi:hypothetical protein
MKAEGFKSGDLGYCGIVPPLPIKSQETFSSLNKVAKMGWCSTLLDFMFLDFFPWGYIKSAVYGAIGHADSI